VVSGELEAGETPKILVREVVALDRAEERFSSRLCLRVPADEATRDRLTALRGLLERNRGECAVELRVVVPGQSETIVSLPGTLGIRPDERLRQEVDALFGHCVTELEA
jgi:DNA polymerase-3 subunit alpha